MSESLSAFLLARIQEDEARARAAIDDDGGSDEGFSGQYAALVKPPSGVGIAQGGFGEAAARMIATYAVPARVLAECEAKRRIIELHYNGSPETDLNRCSPCDTVGDDPCATLRALVLPYADHPACDPAWLPAGTHTTHPKDTL